MLHYAFLIAVHTVTSPCVDTQKRQHFEEIIPLKYAPNTLHFSTQSKPHAYPLCVVGDIPTLDVMCHRNRHQTLDTDTKWRCQANFRHLKGERDLFRRQLHKVSVHWKSALIHNQTAFVADSWSATAYLKTEEQQGDYHESQRQVHLSWVERLVSFLTLAGAMLLVGALVSQCSGEFLLGGLIGGLLCMVVLDDDQDTESTSVCDGNSDPY